MKVAATCLMLLTAGVGRTAAKEANPTVSVDSNEADDILTPQNNYNGWVNPEDLPPMPQCIAQQDQYLWLSTMTKCTRKLCTRHFGLICSHHQWLTQLSCLEAEFSVEVLKEYVPRCSRAILAKAQLYSWIHEVTRRTWLIDVGDANDVQDLSPASLRRGYASMDAYYKAPICLTESLSTQSQEPFEHVLASCRFMATTQHTGNAARPWEYNESQRSLITLDSETIGYDLTSHRIEDGDYFDKACFCGAYAMDMNNEPCPGPDTISLGCTRERLWIHAICGPEALPHNWKEGLKIIDPSDIAPQAWRWPSCVDDIPWEVINLSQQCQIEVCDIGPGGFCKDRVVIDRACVCQNINYESCGGSCHYFDGRIEYVEWLHDLCSDVKDWHGLPSDWRELAAPIPLDLIPWRWTLKPSNASYHTPTSPLGSTSPTETCPSNSRKLGSIVVINMATVLVAFFSRSSNARVRNAMFAGIFVAGLQLLANWSNALTVQSSLGYEDSPLGQLVLLWCTMPRLTCLATLLIRTQPSKSSSLSAIKSVVLAEMILQLLSMYYMFMTVLYGVQHGFYIGGIGGAKRGGSALMMYIGALLWVIIVCPSLVHSVRLWATPTDSFNADDGGLRSKNTNSVEELVSQFNQGYDELTDQLADYWVETTSQDEGPRSPTVTTYGTLPVNDRKDWSSRRALAKIYAATFIHMLPLWTVQWLFWAGFIGLSSNDFCPPKLEVLTFVWIACSIVGATVGAA